MTIARNRILLSTALLGSLAAIAVIPSSVGAENTKSIVVSKDDLATTLQTRGESSPDTGPWTVAYGLDHIQVQGADINFAADTEAKMAAFLRQSEATDVTITESIVVPELDQSSQVTAALIGRLTNDAQSYQMRFDVNGGGKVDLAMDRVSPSGTATIGSAVGVSDLATPGEKLHLKATILGSSPVKISATIWKDGTPEPTPQFQAEDNDPSQLTNSGPVGTALRSGPARTKVRITDFNQTAIDNPPPEPAPSAEATSKPVGGAQEATQTSATKPSRGSVPVGQAEYEIPANAVFVSTDGDDSSPGTRTAPKRSVAAAAKAVPAGGTIVVRGGVYHEDRVDVFKPLTVQNYPREAVWFDGSRQVSGWTRSGSTWQADWDVVWDHSPAFEEGGTNDQLLDPAYPVAAWPDQTYVDGSQLQQVPLEKGVKEGQFAVDYANKKLIIGTNPEGREVRAADRDQLFTVGSPDVTLRGFGVRRYANSLPTLGVIYMARQRNLVTNVVVEDVASTGITMFSDKNQGSGTIDRVTVRRSGIMGISGMNFDNGKVLNSVITDSNTERFNPFPSSAGIKVTRSKNVTFDNNLIENSYHATGIWADESTIGITATRNEITNTRLDGFAGIQLELSSRGVVADNLILGQDRGVYIFDTSDIQVVNNTIYDSRVADISVDQDFRRQANPNHVGHDERNPIPDSSNTWISSGNRIKNNLFGTDSRDSNFQLFVHDKDQAFSAGQMVSEVSGNAFESKKEGVSPTLIGWGKSNGEITQHNDLAEWSSSINKGWKNSTYPVNSPVSKALDLANQNAGATGLDADIAKLIGQSSGSTRVGSFQKPTH